MNHTHATAATRGMALATVSALLCAILLSEAAVSPTLAQTPGYDSKGCGWYIVLGCSGNRAAAKRVLADLGGPMVGGGAGSRVLNTSDIDGFRNGFYCVADGPYISRADAGSVAWVEAVPDAYVKRGC